MDIENRQQLIKKLLYQSCNRGCKETDLIIGQFAKLNIKEMKDNELQIFNKILQLTDADIYDWYTRKKDVPTEHKSHLMSQILNFEPSSK
ncbi:MAG: succinate dehydrogenase assembly factor 2 [Rickettsiaceae bacterium]|nr:succinate dehydrogenase assembly factor 2 [Rickettsiaceae bacterium]MDP4832820.1 succinate dehydrogenase assembly factor 2 [Rickettsiaceae bacterium]MDP5083373.1 succinate dehydrogenase assembly factor 2 [Rickettsiaceae bacterium]